ncbi:glycogenin-2 isoform X3 [Physeter macrocephalus]|uniref:glycogenin glucosyltransferase n=1 Tax=Physeter macrocephalus TaxID=9755 RepID=A0A455BHK5_PHYMC|nr:glycogenin-2 isoform X3 [Physeter catodon]|eukprot:XP_028348294.1 glycogenin-2 isoform X3 [Physeter catodon]
MHRARLHNPFPSLTERSFSKITFPGWPLPGQRTGLEPGPGGRPLQTFTLGAGRLKAWSSARVAWRRRLRQARLEAAPAPRRTWPPGAHGALGLRPCREAWIIAACFFDATPKPDSWEFLKVSDQAFVTLATNDVYCQGALVLGQSLRDHRATRRLVVLVTPQVSNLLRVILSRVFDEVIEVNLIDSVDYIHLAFLKRPELGVTLTKLHCWTLTHYSKCVFLDADTLVLSNIDELFNRREFSAAPDPGWPDCFNSGVFVFQPSLETHGLLLQHATDHGSFDGADQGLLNSFFSSWSTADIQKHLPFIYNLSSNTAYTYSPAFKQFGSSVKVVHFLGSTKPWNYTYNPQTGSVLEEGSGSVNQHQTSFLNLWWGIYHRSILPLYENIRHEDEQTSPGHTAHLGGPGVPCSSSAPTAEGSCANAVPRSTEPCTNWAEGPRQPWPERTMVVVEETPASPDACPVEDQPVESAEGGPSEEALEPSREPPVDVTRDPSLQDALEVVSSLFALSSSPDGCCALTWAGCVHALALPPFRASLVERRVCLLLLLPQARLSSLWHLSAVVGPPSFLSSALIITPVLSSKAVLQKLIEGGPGPLRLRDFHRRKGQGTESRGGTEEVGGGVHRLPGEGCVCPDSGEAGPLPAVMAPLRWVVLFHEHLESFPRERLFNDVPLFLVDQLECFMSSHVVHPKPSSKACVTPATHASWGFPRRLHLLYTLSAKGNRNSLLVNPGSLVLLEGAQDSVLDRCCRVHPP